MKITALWIAKNEEENLALSIRSLREAVDEMIVVDTGSEDGTVETARALGAQVAFFQWISDFSAARNYALSLATGDIVIFVDCDEYFSPAWGPKERARLVNFFERNPSLEAISPKRCEFNKNIGLVTGAGYYVRILRRTDELNFVNKIHERPVGKDGRLLNTIDVSDWELLHTGYSTNVIENKLSRNITILEQQMTETLEPVEKLMTDFYLMREYMSSGRISEATEHLKKVFSKDQLIVSACKMFGLFMVGFLYGALRLIAMPEVRGQFSRKDVYNRLISLFVRIFPNYPGMVALDLYYQYLFHYREDRFMKAFDSVMETAKSLPVTAPLDYQGPQARLNGAAALATWYRKDRLRAFDYAVAGLQSPLEYDALTLFILLDCMKGQPPEEIVGALAGVLDFGHEATLPFLVKSLYISEHKALYLYYVKKAIDQGVATKGDYLYFLMLTAGVEASVSAAQVLTEASDAETVAFQLFVAAVCGGASVLPDDAVLPEAHARVLRHYFDNTALESPSKEDIALFKAAYRYVAFAADVETADRLADVFAAAPRMQFFVRAGFLIDNGQYEAVWAADRSKLGEEPACWRIVLQSCVLTDRYDEALSLIKEAFKREDLAPYLLPFLSVVADNSTGETKEEARALYEDYAAVFEELMDLLDVVNTGITFVGDEKRQIRALKAMTPAQWKKQCAADRDAVTPPALLTMLERAADAYEQNGAASVAIRCRARLLAHGHHPAENRAELIRLFLGTGNESLAREIEREGA